jgi:hypothetical protein
VLSQIILKEAHRSMPESTTEILSMQPLLSRCVMRAKEDERESLTVFVCALLLFISSQQAHTHRAASSENETAVCVFAEPLCGAFVSYIADAAAFLIKPPQICIF